MEVDIEVFTSSVCSRCQRILPLIEQWLAEEEFQSIVWREVDVLSEIDYAVAKGVLMTPTIIIGGQSMLSLPTKQQFYDALRDYQMIGFSTGESQ